ncbi:chemotaxis protein CheA [Chondromyces crocatus]|uniref:Chemotaxis protein CheA n=1 Tax=Chondromyces crocatus TaxID=52 RepID=A0A0K1E5Q5_CHOCO|nr:chemotaxis protein CheW [Chondromyces crocatus]AKT36206.1 chemotaxis protein A [Chondromyces crocatus]
MVDVAEFRSAYLAEVDDHLETAGAHLLSLERTAAQGRSDPRAVREVFRALHTIKGLSAMMGVETIVAISHRMEGLLRWLQQGSAPSPATIDVLFQGTRAIAQSVRALSEGAPPTEAPRPLLDALDALIVGSATSPPAHAPTLTLPEELAAKLSEAETQQLAAGVSAGRRALRVDFSPSPDLAERGLTITSVRERVGALSEIIKVVPFSRPPTEEAPAGLTFSLILLATAPDQTILDAAGLPPSALTPLLTQPKLSAALTTTDPPLIDAEEPSFEVDEVPRRGVLRVELGRIDEAMDRLSALVVTRYRLERCASEMAEVGAPVRELTRLLAEQARELRDLRSALLRVRMVPMSEILDRLPLVLRSLRRDTGKKVRLQIEGSGAELDKAVAERLLPAIIHIVRNAVDHGIESPEERAPTGKPDEGTLRINCSTVSSAALSISIADDGRGVDRASVAQRSGVASSAELDDTALLDLLCSPGLSTRLEATTTSGRGMGMNIARRVITTDLGGELTMTTTQGAGTTFTLRVPLTVAILDAFAFLCDGQHYVAPIAMIDEIVEIDPASVIHGPGGMPLFERRGTAVPVVPLSVALAGNTAPPRLPAARSLGAGSPGPSAQTPGIGARESDEARKALIVRRGGEATALTVDRLLGHREAVIRPLTDPLVQVTGVSGATDLGDGKPTLVLDLIALVGAVNGRRGALARVEGE